MSDKPKTVTQYELDRLAEGELTPPERRELVRRIEARDDGWRRCALALLEAQSWRKACQTLVADCAEPTQEADRVRPIWHGHGIGRRHIAAVAAIVLVAFGIGLTFGKLWNGEATARIASDAPTPLNVPSERTATANSKSNFDAHESNDDKAHLVGYVSLTGVDGGDSKIPIVSGPGLDETWLAGRPAPLTDNELVQLERLGWQVQHRRQLVKIEYEDGRRLTIPIDTVNYQSVPRRVY